MARRSVLVVAAAGLSAAVAGGAWAAAALGSTEDTEAEPAAALRAVPAEERDLVEHLTLDGTVDYAITRQSTASVAGTVTAVAAAGQTVERGDVVYEIDARPVVVLYGDVPHYRPLAEGDEGDDVEQLEANLASLGHHVEVPIDLDGDGGTDDEDEVDTGFTVDGVFDGATADAVRRWQADLGLTETGQVAVGDVVFVPGPSVVSSSQAELGSTVQPGAPVVDLAAVGLVEAFHNPRAGEVELVATAGPVESGQVLLTVDERPVTAVVTDETIDRDLAPGVDDGPDVRVAEEMLTALGFDARGDLTVDEEFDDATAEAIEDWEEALADEWDDVEVDGILSLDQIAVVAPGTAVEAVTERAGDEVAAGSQLFTWTPDGDHRIVRTAVDVADQILVTAGTDVDVEFPDGSVVTGTVAAVALTSTTDPTTPDAEPRLAVDIALPELPPAYIGLGQLDVEVLAVESLAAGATVVPASALLATEAGGYAVEVVGADGSTIERVAVEPGRFADGWVEVDGIEPGTPVVVPS